MATSNAIVNAKDEGKSSSYDPGDDLDRKESLRQGELHRLSSAHVGNDTTVREQKSALDPGNRHQYDTTDVQPGTDAVYAAKVALMNEAILDIGMGRYQWMTVVLTGFGWFVDNFWMQAITIISPPVQAEFNVERIAFLTVGKYAGLVVGSSVWPLAADFIGRKFAFNITLLISSFAGLIGAGAPSFVGIATLCAFIGLGTGGNQPVDSAIFLEFIPASHQYLLTMQSAFWSVGQALAALIGWPLIVKYSCPSDTPPGQCSYQDNQGWRYTFWAFGGITLALSIIRFSFKMYETPKYLLGKGYDKKAVEVVQNVARRNGTTTWLTIEHFERVDRELEQRGLIMDQEMTANEAIIRRAASKWQFTHIRGLFATPKMALSTTLIIIIWASIGMAYPLYNSFIPFYLAQKGVSTGTGSLAITYRNYAIQAVCGIPASIMGGFLVEVKYIGRKGTGSMACILTGVFLFLFTRAESSAAVLGFSCAIAFFQNLVYGLLYSYTPEVFPAPLRGTGNGLSALFNRLSGLMAPIIVAYSGVTTSLPVWISAGLFIVTGLTFLILPYETRGKASS